MYLSVSLSKTSNPESVCSNEGAQSAGNNSVNKFTVGTYFYTTTTTTKVLATEHVT